MQPHRLWPLLAAVCLQAQGADWTLNPGPYSVTELGSPVTTALQENNVTFLDANGHRHWVSLYDTDQFSFVDYEIVDVNTTTGAARLVSGDLGRPNMYNTAVGGDNNLYIGSNDPGYLVRYNPVTGVATKLGKLRDNSARILQAADDGNIVIGECCFGGVERWNIGTSTLEDYGRLDPAGGGYQYSYSIGADARYIYVGLGQSPWYLGIYDMVGGTTNLYWKADGDAGGAIYQGAAGGWFYERNLAGGGASQWYALTNGVPVATNAPAALNYYWSKRGGLVDDTVNFPALASLEADLADTYPDGANNSATFRWRASGVTQWSTATVTGFTLQPSIINRLIRYSANELMGAGYFYGPVFRWSTITNGVSAQLGRPRVSLYDMLKSGTTVWLSGYAANTLTYSTGAAWTLNGSTDINSPAINPHSLGTGFGKYHYYSALGSDGNLYVGAHHERSSTGGELGWYPVTSGARGSERTAFLNDDVADLLSIQAGAKLAYASTSSNLFIFDVATRTITNTFQPLTNASPGKLIETDNGSLLGASGTTLYLMNPTTGALTLSTNVGAQVFGGVRSYDRRLVKGPDSCGWLYIGNVLSRVNPTNLTVTPILTNTARNLVFQGGDIYLYGTTNLSVVSGVLSLAWSTMNADAARAGTLRGR